MNNEDGDVEEDDTAEDILAMLAKEGDIISVPVSQDELGELQVSNKETFIPPTLFRKISQVSIGSTSSTSSQKSLMTLNPALLSEDLLRQLCAEMHTSRLSNDIRTTRSFRRAFLGSVAVSWIADNVFSTIRAHSGGSHSPGVPQQAQSIDDEGLKCSREDAVAIGQRIVDHGWILCCEPKGKQSVFSDDKTVFRFLCEELLLEDEGGGGGGGGGLSSSSSSEPSLLLKLLAERMRHPETGVTQKDRTFLMKKYRQIFSDADAATWLIRSVPGIADVTASQLLKILERHGLIERLLLQSIGQHTFYQHRGLKY